MPQPILPETHLEQVLRIGGISFRVTLPCVSLAAEPDIAYHSFRFSGEEVQPGEIPVSVLSADIPPIPPGARVFDARPGWWYAAAANGKWFRGGEGLSRSAEWAMRMGDNEIVLHARASIEARVNPFRYPVDQLALIHFLARRGGFLAHSVGFEVDGRGFVLCGVSGAGKTTLARLLAGTGRVRVLSDDRIVLQEMAGGTMLSGTPWPGDAGIAENRSVSLRGLAFLSHGSESRARRMGKGVAFEKLLKTVSIPWYDRDLAEGVMKVMADVVEIIPAFDFEFRPEAQAVECLLSALMPGSGHT